ncbi:hypothetical protein MMC18_005683 [Xylographa bjoerkii]|nr:hypothetical protein [Xylographa bjoerkii]
MNTNVWSDHNTTQTSQQNFRELGAGSCGIVFVHHDPTTVLKKANHDDAGLWNDYTMQLNVHAQLERSRPLLHRHTLPLTTRPKYFIASENHKWWHAHASKFPPGHQTPPTRVLCLERIPPLSKQTREHLIDTFCLVQSRAGAKSSAGNADCIARLYLGRRRRPSGRPQRFFSLRNFSLHLDMVEELGLDVEACAAQMARGLAVCHWRARVDANDVEFVPGGRRMMDEALGWGALSWEQVGEMPVDSDTMVEDAWTYRRRLGLETVVENANESLNKTGMRLWMLDYDKCHGLEWSDEGIKQAVVAVEENDPYFPKPHKEGADDQRLWESFKEGYRKASEVIMVEDEIQEEVLDLPGKFLHEWEGFWWKKVEQARVNALVDL